MQQWHLFQMVDQNPVITDVLDLVSCVKACPFDAIHIVDGIAKVDEKDTVKHVENVLLHVQNI